jgi:PTS system glucitol/sorbitol-specific IIB component
MTQIDTPATHRNAFVRPGKGGWGKGLLLNPSGTRTKIISVTGGGIHPVAQRIADITGCEAIDGFHTGVPDSEVLCAVINCGGTARIGVYPRKKIMTIDVYPGAPGGPLARFITEDLFVSAVGCDDVSMADPALVPDHAAALVGAASPSAAGGVGTDPTVSADPGHAGGGGSGPNGGGTTATGGGQGGPLAAFSNAFVRLGTGIGYAVNTLLASGREAITITINTILPFMAYVSLLLGFVLYTGIANDLGHALKPLSSNIGGLILIGIITALPFLSPILGPGAAVAQVIGILLGTEIALRNVPVSFALPTLFAIDGQVGCDFIPVGLGLGEAEAETVAVGVPAVLFSRLITSPLAVGLAWVASIGLK